MSNYIHSEISPLISKLNKPIPNINIHVVVPYYTRKSIEFLTKNTRIAEIGLNIKLYKRIYMKTLKEYIDDNIDIETQKHLTQVFTSVFNIPITHIPIYFDHKLPDSFSSYPEMYNGILPNLIKVFDFDIKTENTLEHCIDNSKFRFIPYISNCQEIDIDLIKSKNDIYENYCPPAFYKTIFPTISVYEKFSTHYNIKHYYY